MDGLKSVLISKTIWGAFFAILAVGLSLAGIDIGETGLWTNDIVALAGSLFAIYGRVVATKQIKL